MRFGIVQGRLTESQELQAFPKDWEKEFWIAWHSVGLDYIELISEREHNQDNPIWDYTGKKLKDTKTPVVCNDYIINHSLKDDPASRLWTYRLIEQASLINCGLVVLPMMEESESVPKEIISEIELYAARNNTTIALETVEDSDYYPFNIVYDTGNRVDAGLNPTRDIKRLGKRIVHVHIKDKNWNGDNVLLGTGDVDFKEVCQALKDIGYDGTMTFETVRGKDPIKTAKYNLEFIKFFLSEAQ